MYMGRYHRGFCSRCSFTFRSFPPLGTKALTPHNEFSSKVQRACTELALTESVVLGRALPFFVKLCHQSIGAHGPGVWGISDSFSRSTRVLALWTFCYTRHRHRWFGRCRLSKMCRCSEPNRARPSRSYEQCLGWQRLRILRIWYPHGHHHGIDEGTRC